MQALVLLSTFPQMANLVTKFFLVGENIRSLEHIDRKQLLPQPAWYLHTVKLKSS